MQTIAADTTARDLLRCLVGHGYTLATGVPCSLLSGAFRLLENAEAEPGLAALRYLPAPREDTAIGVASGAAAIGERSVVFMQNSGLGYSLNVLTSFNLIYEVPVLLVVSWRGYGGKDAVEHDVIGAELLRLLALFRLPYTILDNKTPAASVDAVIRQLESENRCSVLIVKEGI